MGYAGSGMLQSLMEYARAVAASLRLADALDIAVVSVIVYASVSWFLRSRSRLVMSGLGTLALLYFAALFFDMHLTLALFRAGLTVAVVALVVIFQEEIRRAFERVALASRFQSTSGAQTADATVDVVVESVAAMAKTKTGALIVFGGREPLARHITGGIPLNGRISEPLLLSIFDPSSAGHDGALVIEDGLATRFAVHLPLSPELGGHERFGTRHAAALGLSERCDALVVVVSEERGVISVAKDGKLTQLASSAELKKRILAFKARVAPERQTRRVTQLFTRAVGIKLLSVAVALAAWLIAYDYRSETAVRSMNVPIVFENVPKGWAVGEPSPLEVLVSLSGPKRQLEGLERGQVNVAIDVSNLKQGLQRVPISTNAVTTPAGFVARDVQPGAVTFSAERTVTTTVSVSAKTIGKLPQGRWLKAVTVAPREIELIVPRSRRAGLKHVTTEDIALDKLRESTKLERELMLPSGTALAPGAPESVTVRIEVGRSVP